LRIEYLTLFQNFFVLKLPSRELDMFMIGRSDFFQLSAVGLKA
jgi:hypothetical protein